MRTRFGAIRAWMQTLTDVEIARVADATTWDRGEAWQDGVRYHGSKPGCLLCHAYAIMTPQEYGHHSNSNRAKTEAEYRYMALADRRGEDEAGKLMQAMARAVIARRTLSAMPPLPTASVKPELHATV